jgi:hypothetical protein
MVYSLVKELEMEANKIRYSRVYKSANHMPEGFRAIYLAALKVVAENCNDYDFSVPDLSGSFVWSRTPQGHVFWSGIYGKIGGDVNHVLNYVRH